MKGADLHASLTAIPLQLREPLISEFLDALSEYRAGDWEKVGTKAGKFCEIAFNICDGHATGTYAQAPNKPRNMLQSCQSLERFNRNRGRSLCIQIPRILMGMYELRNNRAIGHVGGDVDPNEMDAEYLLRGMKWIVGEFVRFYSRLPEGESRAIVEAVTVRTHRSIWREGNVVRVLDPSKSAREKVLIVAYAENCAIKVPDLAEWAEYSNLSRFRATILKDLHGKALIHFNKKEDTVRILPPGQNFVEEQDLLIEF